MKYPHPLGRSTEGSATLRHTANIQTYALFPDGPACNSGTVPLSACSGKRIGQALKRRQTVTAVAVSPDGQTVASASEDGSAGWGIDLGPHAAFDPPGTVTQQAQPGRPPGHGQP